MATNMGQYVVTSKVTARLRLQKGLYFYGLFVFNWTGLSRFSK